MQKLVTMTLASTLLLAAAGPASAQGKNAADRQALFGELHLHTGYSTDAVILGGTTVTPDEAYRYGRGEPVPYMGGTVQRRWPLDFMAVTDHAENIGLGSAMQDASSPAGKSDLGRRIRERVGASGNELRALFMSRDPIQGVDARKIARDAWQHEIDAVKRHYVPGKFTTLLAYEWSATPDFQNLHRNVIFRGTEAPEPFSQADSERPEDLWGYLEKNRKRGIEALAIPHNSNVSNGLMFDWVDSDGKPISKAYAQLRLRNEPLVEISQTKGQSETHPLLSPNDEFAGFEIFDTLLGAQKVSKAPGSYVRDAYGRGLMLAARTGANPYKFGVVGAGDLHNGLSDSDEDRYAGPNGSPNIDREQAAQLLGASTGGAPISLLPTGSSSLTGLWADSNTREDVYDALRRKEAFATTGTRIRVRLFGGWAYDAATLSKADWVRAAYAGGVPMGGDLPARPNKADAPRFLVWAAKDPAAANLERVQIIKVWLDGETHREKIFDVAVAPLKPGTKVTPGVSEFAASWSDPEFDATRPAVYYLRVLEVPTLRWSTLLAARFGLPAPQGVPATIQERAWSSPIWYTPKK